MCFTPRVFPLTQILLRFNMDDPQINYSLRDSFLVAVQSRTLSLKSLDFISRTLYDGHSSERSFSSGHISSRTTSSLVMKNLRRDLCVHYYFQLRSNPPSFYLSKFLLRNDLLIFCRILRILVFLHYLICVLLRFECFLISFFVKESLTSLPLLSLRIRSLSFHSGMT